jgi:hypothetical protein
MQFDVTFPAVRCSILSLDTMDISGERHHDIVCIPQISLYQLKLHVHTFRLIADFALYQLTLFLFAAA